MLFREVVNTNGSKVEDGELPRIWKRGYDSASIEIPARLQQLVAVQWMEA